MSDQTLFKLRINEGPTVEFAASHSEYSLAVMEAFGCLGLPYPCDVEIWVDDLVAAGYGPYLYKIADFVDARGNEYGAPAVMTARRA
ncbi:hypothetical protein [Mesorhizobium sp. WSM4982]|uniref:hypothetical protein n=1 Tax=Mesorhizobium sp. WSM4982 TaxID=3038550 RepID=UPI002415785C|nr:hypothetical protein [Mesorhizobium sp. WSM4982]MDG4856395.1 hypothetical protein [Mesorhizobium sp. WSM4982]